MANNYALSIHGKSGWAMSDASIDELLEAAKDGDDRAFAELSGRYLAMARQKIYRILKHPEDTEDALQDALLKAFRHLGQFRGSSSFSTWFTRIAINSALMLLRKRRIRAESSYDLNTDEHHTWDVWEFPDPAPDPEDLCSRRQVDDLVRHAVCKLPTKFRSLVEHYHALDNSLEETANVHAISQGAAKSRLRRARTSLRSSLTRAKLSIVDVR